MNIGIFGVGNFGATHIKVLKEIKEFNIIGFFDPNTKRAKVIEERFYVKLYTQPDNLIEKCDAIDVVSETKTHFDIIQMAIKHNKHIFIEKPICIHKSELINLMKLKSNYQPIIQVGHIERYNPAIQEGFKDISNIETIKTKRTGPLNDRNSATSITLDFMIHDIDLVLSLIKEPIISIEAVGLKQKNGLYNYVKSLLLFENGAKAELIAERDNTINNERNMLITCRNKTIEIDLLKRMTKTIIKKEAKSWQSENNINPLKNQFVDFYHNITKNLTPIVGLTESCKAVDTALKIDAILNRKS
mgnify:CR=1 FL=1